MATTPYEQTVDAFGGYPYVDTAMTAAVTVQLVDGLNMNLETDRTYWVNGLMKYTATISNSSGVDFTDPDLTFALNPTVMTFVEDSVKISGSSAQQGTEPGEYEYSNNNLLVHLDTITDGTSGITVEYSVSRA